MMQLVFPSHERLRYKKKYEKRTFAVSLFYISVFPPFKNEPRHQ